MNQVLNWLPFGLEASDVRLLTRAPNTKSLEAQIMEQLKQRAGAINARPGRAIVIQVKFTLARDFPYMHDRFAIVDDELWHFGATVGGLHTLVNAATRGWRADDHKAVEFFETAWNGDRGSEQRRRSRAPARGVRDV
jgi:hypothetical protein